MMVPWKRKVICLMGATATGKTDIAVDWATRYPFDIVSVDSAMVYRHMNIGTAKPHPTVLQQVPHRLIDILEPTARYSVADFCTDALREINTIYSAGRIPLLVGGTMLYFHALQQGLAALPPANEQIRQQLTQDAAHFGNEVLHQRLQKIDPKAAQHIKPTDGQRLQRALEVFLITGKPISALQRRTTKADQYAFINIVMIPDARRQLHQRIAQRFQHMLARGLVEEVEQLRNDYHLSLELPAMRAVGYRQVWQYLDGRYDWDTMRAKALAATRQLAKRQITWLRSWANVHRYPTDPMELLATST